MRFFKAFLSGQFVTDSSLRTDRPEHRLRGYFKEPHMRCYFMQNGHIAGVEVLDPAEGDEGCIKRAHTLFETRSKTQSADGFEVWDHARFVFRFPPDLKTPGSKSASGLP